MALIERQNDAKRTYRVAYGELTAPLVKAIQEQQAEINAQREKIADLETRNSDLRQLVKQQVANFKAENDALRQSLAVVAKRIDAMKLAQNSARAE